MIEFFINKPTAESSVKNGNLWIVVEFGEDIKFTEWSMNYAAQYGHLKIVKWLHHNRNEGCTMWAMDMAAGNGHLEIVKFLHENRSEGCTINAMDYAAKNGHLEVVKFLHENRNEGRLSRCYDRYILRCVLD